MGVASIKIKMIIDTWQCHPYSIRMFYLDPDFRLGKAIYAFQTREEAEAALAGLLLLDQT